MNLFIKLDHICDR